MFEQLVTELRKIDTTGEAKHWLDKTAALIGEAKK